MRWADRCAQRIAIDGGVVMMVRRVDFDRRLADAAVQSGAELHDGEPVRALRRVPDAYAVETSRDSYRARVLLLATGAEPSLGAALGLPRPRAVMAPAIEIEAPVRWCALDPDVAILDYCIPGGYAWAFPKGASWNVGVVTARAHPGAMLRGQLDAALQRWRMQFERGAVPRCAGRRIPMGMGRQPLHAGRAALLGDAAALADRFFGEGIAGALWSGELAATAALDVLAGRRDDLAAYSESVHRMLGPHMRHAAAAARVVYAQARLAAWALRHAPPVRRIAERLTTEAVGPGRQRPA
jgi:flavin-dependent dehydrogenase